MWCTPARTLLKKAALSNGTAVSISLADDSVWGIPLHRKAHDSTSLHDAPMVLGDVPVRIPSDEIEHLGFVRNRVASTSVPAAW